MADEFYGFLERGLRGLAGERIGKYDLLEPLSDDNPLDPGKRPIVFAARRLVEGNIEALKVFPKGSIAQWEEEARVLTTLSKDSARPRCRSLVQFWGSSEEGGYPCLAMELARGKTLDRVWDRDNPERMSLLEYVSIFLEVVDAIQHIHQSRLIHADIKPSNIVVHRQPEAPVVRLVDLGSAVPLNGWSPGTRGYQSPEQERREPLTPATDIYSLGCIMFENIIGDYNESRLHVLGEPSARVANAEALHSLLARCLSRDPASRSTIGVVRKDLQEIADRELLSQPLNAKLVRRKRWGVIAFFAIAHSGQSDRSFRAFRSLHRSGATFFWSLPMPPSLTAPRIVSGSLSGREVVGPVGPVGGA